MSRVEVALGARSYTISIEAGLLDRTETWLAPFARHGRLVVVADEQAWAVQGHRLTGFDIALTPVPAGEASKSWGELARVVEALLALGVERGDTIISFGGGMVGDLTGFAAAILKRGCGCVHIPTTLLAQVDAAVGGKTAINAAAGKNLVGAFHQPRAVLIDPTTLGTLAPRQLRSGYAEVVKYGLISDPAFFDWCEASGAALLAGDEAARAYAIETCVRAKARVVAADERETKGERALLNFGHTFGHALEAEAGFSDALLHGEAVALGMVLAFRFSTERGLCPVEDADRVEAHLRSVGLAGPLPFAAEALMARMENDKKSSGGRLNFILTRGVGKAFVESDVAPGEVEDFLRRAFG